MSLKGEGAWGHTDTQEENHMTQRQRDESDTAISQERSAQDCLQPPEAGVKSMDSLPHNHQKKPTLTTS